MPFRTRTIWTVLLCVALLTVSTVGHAQDGLHDEANRAFAEGRYEEAIRLMVQANQLNPHPSYLFNISIAYTKLGDCSNASLWATSALEAENPALPPEGRERAAEIIDECTATAGQPEDERAKIAVAIAAANDLPLAAELQTVLASAVEHEAFRTSTHDTLPSLGDTATSIVTCAQDDTCRAGAKETLEVHAWVVGTLSEQGENKHLVLTVYPRDGAPVETTLTLAGGKPLDGLLEQLFVFGAQVDPIGTVRKQPATGAPAESTPTPESQTPSAHSETHPGYWVAGVAGGLSALSVGAALYFEHDKRTKHESLAADLKLGLTQDAQSRWDEIQEAATLSNGLGVTASVLGTIAVGGLTWALLDAGDEGGPKHAFHAGPDGFGWRVFGAF